MAIKIDLLPAYVKLRRDWHRSLAACVVVAGLVVGGLLTLLYQRQLELETAKTNLAAAQLVQTKTATATSNTATINGQAAPYVSAISFMSAASKTGPQRAALLNLVRQYIYGDAIVSSIDISDGQRVVIRATVRDTDEYARFVNSLRRASDVQGGSLFKGLPTASGPGGFANGAVPFLPPVANGEPAVPIIYPISVSAEGVLLNPIQLPPDPVGGAGAAGAPGGVPGGPGGPPPGVPGGPGGPPGAGVPRSQ
ncbi:MAG TPA: hypothetical protein VF627_11405 [Abditibacterium sp.]|jgi:hypothetical protein